MSSPKVVALGGGHGLAASLSALRLVCDDITAVVTVADDGGSSGRLRQEFGVLPPGDLRMALAALCDDTPWGHQWRDVLQHRFSGTGPLAGHALGNLLIVALWDLDPDAVSGLDLVGQLLNARGRVLPMASVPLDIVASVALDDAHPERLSKVVGQHEVATTGGVIRTIGLEPAEPPCGERTLAAIHAADVVVLGPGSWFTSVLPHLLVPDLRAALKETRATRVLTLNLELHTEEPRGLTAVGHIQSLTRHAPDITLDVVLADPSAVDDVEALSAAASAVGARLVVAPVAGRHPGQHDTLRLAAAYRDLILD